MSQSNSTDICINNMPPKFYWGTDDDDSYRDDVNFDDSDDSDDEDDDDDDDELSDVCSDISEVIDDNLVAWNPPHVYQAMMRGTMVYPNGDELVAQWSLRTNLLFPMGIGVMKYVGGQTLTCGWEMHLNTTRFPFEHTARGAGALYLEDGNVRHIDPKYSLYAHGEGTLISSRGYELKCTWIRGLANGAGFMKYSDGITLECDYRDGELDGEGTMTYPNGDRVVGYWTRGVRQLHTRFISYETGRVEKFKDRKDGPVTKTDYEWKHNNAMRELRRLKDERKKEMETNNR